MDQSELERNKAVIRRFVEEVQIQRNFDVLDELHDPEFVDLSSPPGVPSGREGSKIISAGSSTRSDARFTIDDVIAEGDASSRRRSWPERTPVTGRAWTG